MPRWSLTRYSSCFGVRVQAPVEPRRLSRVAGTEAEHVFVEHEGRSGAITVGGAAAASVVASSTSPTSQGNAVTATLDPVRSRAGPLSLADCGDGDSTDFVEALHKIANEVSHTTTVVGSDT